MLSRASRARLAVPRAALRPVSRAAISTSILNRRIPTANPPVQTPIISRKMSAHQGESTLRPEPDKVLTDIADYIHNYTIDSELAYETARLCLIDTIGCGLEGLRFPDCANLLGPVVEGTIVPNGAYRMNNE